MHTKTAVVVDDSPIEANLAARILGECGAQVLAVCNDGAQGWAQIEDHKPTLVVLDINLPNINGIQIARLIRQANLNTKIVMCSGMKLASVQRQLDGLNVAKFIKKPYDDILTGREIRSVLGG